MELTILMPCLNEAETLSICIQKARTFLSKYNIEGEVLISDNGSTDGSVDIAKKEGARITHVKDKGYGNALKEGIKQAKGKFVIMGDADDSYDFLHLEEILEKLRQGNDLVMGDRFAGGIKPGAMPWLHRYIGNPILSFVGRLFFNAKINDFHCGLRGFKRERIIKLHLITPGMEFASEMVVKACISNYKIAEVPIVLYKDGRTKPPHLNTWGDGWRHLTFLLMYSPKWLFFFPALFLLLLSGIGVVALLPGIVKVNTISLDIHTLTIAGFSIVLSYQLFLSAVLVRIYSLNHGLYPVGVKHLYFFKIFTLERGLAMGFIILFMGLVSFFYLLNFWSSNNYGEIDNIRFTFRILIPSITFISIGIQTIFSSFILRIIGINPNVNYKNETH